MKKLSDITIEDAKEVLKSEYPLFFETGRWFLSDESEGVGEPCKKMYCKTKSYMFWFFDDCIDIELIDQYINFDVTNFDVKLGCYVKAHNLGYKIFEFDNLKTT